MTRNRRHTSKNIDGLNTPTISSQTVHILKNSWNMICKHNNLPLAEIVDVDDAYIKRIRTQNMYVGIPDDIRQEFESTSQRGIKTEFILPRGRKVIVSIIVPANKKDGRHDFMEYLNRILIWLHFIDGIASPKCAQTLNIYLLLTDAKKKMPTNDYEEIGMVHANTAFTTSCSAENEIFLFRREEWFKVFIHETFHCFGLDFSSSFGDDSNTCILSIFPALNPNTDVRLYETFCEMWAELFNMMFCLFYKPCSHKHITTVCKNKCLPFSSSAFFRILSKERVFSICQSNKILQRYGFRYEDLFTVPAEGKQYYTEKTNTFSYYIIKSLMLWNLDRFIDWCVKHTDKYPPIQFNTTHIAKYCELVFELTRNDGNYGQTTKRYLEKRTSKKSRTRMDKNVLSENTLRMTSIDINSKL